MPENTKLADYLLYLSYLTNKLNGFFEKQSPYIFCRKGCSKCCENGEYPFSRLEYDFIMIGFTKLPPETREEILLKVKKIKQEKEKSNGEFCYECPFLINQECSVYEFRGIICRSFGLMSINPDGLSKIPFCAFEGLNYSNVVEPDTKIISTEKYKKLGKNLPEPLAFNVSYKFLTSENIEENFHLHFGDKKPLIDWF
ncbi:YkgJ family cysteine cluster protein [bacterium]|nr:YkgJ family cysteine cluster protein [bacterium]